MFLFTIAAALLFASIVAAPLALIALGVRQRRWWKSPARRTQLDWSRRPAEA